MNTAHLLSTRSAPRWARLSLLTIASLVGLAGPAMAQITLYEGERFEGRNLSSERRLPNLERNGLGDGAGSAVVLSERWEVCEDTRFRDGCKVLRPGRYPSLGSMGINERIASARPLPANERVDEARYAPVAQAVYDARRRRNERLFEAQVSSVRAVMGPPEQRCWIERESLAPQQDRNNVPGAIAGALLGGILGHQVGGGSGRDIATVGGVVAGAAVGSRVGNNSRPDPNAPSRNVQRCEEVNNSAQIAHYEVNYSFRGQTHQIQTLTPPGATVTVNRLGEPRQ